MTVIVGIQNSTTEQTTCKLLIFVILKFRKQFLVGTLLFIKTFDRFQDECIYNFFVIIPIQTALAEILSFPNIPVSVSLNEYVEIAKLYSTAKSGSFINGTLDGIVNQLKKEGKLTKNCYLCPYSRN